MRKLNLSLPVRNFRRVKLYFGLCLIFYMIFLINGYFKVDNVLGYSPRGLVDKVDSEEFINRRHNRNLQHLYNKEVNISPHLSTIKNKSVGEEKELQLINSTHSNYQRRRNPHIRKRLPGAIIIGVKKSGTRALLEFLRTHPNVRATGPEPHFFDKNYEKGLEWYRNLMPVSTLDQLTIEKTPGYFITKDVPKRIHSMSSTVKLILVVRDPVTRAISDYAQLASKSSKVQSFEKTVLKNNETTVDTTRTIVKVGLYSAHLEKWLKYFPLEQFHFVNGEHLVKNPGHEILKIQQFLDLPILITNNNFYFNQTRGFPCIKKKNGKRPHCLDESKGRKHPYIKPISIKVLRDFYRPFNDEFSRMIGQDFSWTKSL